MEGRFFSASSLEQALIAAARHYGLEPERVAYQDRSRRQGLLRGGRRVVIEVDPARPAREAAEAAPAVQAPPPTPPAATTDPAAAPAAAPRPAPPPRPSSSAAVTSGNGDGRRGSGEPSSDREGGRRGEGPAVLGTPDEIEALDKALDAVMDFLDVDIEWEIRRGEDQVPIVELRGEDADLLVAKNGALLDALDHLLPRMVWGWLGRGLPCRVDCNGFQASHEETLRRVAIESAERVRASGKAETLAPLSPSDRRVIHVALADDPDVMTESVGNGFRKRVRVMPRRDD